MGPGDDGPAVALWLLVRADMLLAAYSTSLKAVKKTTAEWDAIPSGELDRR